jgi:hypothetical protein
MGLAQSPLSTKYSQVGSAHFPYSAGSPGENTGLLKARMPVTSNLRNGIITGGRSVNRTSMTLLSLIHIEAASKLQLLYNVYDTELTVINYSGRP